MERKEGREKRVGMLVLSWQAADVVAPKGGTNVSK